MKFIDFINKVKLSDVVSVIALMVSGISISWNVYRDVLLKPKLKVKVQVSDIIQPGKDYGTFISIVGVNHGPGEITCESVHIRKTSFLLRLIRNSKHAFVVHDYTNPLSSELPKKLLVGERIALLFPYKEKAFLAVRPTDVGLTDSFGRTNWASRRSVKESICAYLKDFKEEKWGQRPE